jgi:hypothetical protein
MIKPRKAKRCFGFLTNLKANKPTKGPFALFTLSSNSVTLLTSLMEMPIAALRSLP